MRYHGSVAEVRDRLHRYWFTYEGAPVDLPRFFRLGCGVTAVDREDAERLIGSRWFTVTGLPHISHVTEDVDVRELDPHHVVPGMGDPSIRGVWFPRT